MEKREITEIGTYNRMAPPFGPLCSRFAGWCSDEADGSKKISLGFGKCGDMVLEEWCCDFIRKSCKSIAGKQSL
jgi:hypothetical protein